MREWLVEKVLSAMSNKLPLGFLAKLDKYARSLFYVLGGSPTTPAEQTSKGAFSWLNSHHKNFFLWLHYMDVHAPYMPPPKYVNQFHGKGVSRYRMSALWRKSAADPTQLSPSEVVTMQDLYDASIKYVDDSIGWLLSKARSRLKNTIIIFTADHGDEFGEHGKAGHLTLYDGIVHVPLLISGPGIESGAMVRNQVSLLDLAPTIVALTGLKKVDTFCGKPMIPLTKGGDKATRGVISTAIPPGAEQKLILAYRTPRWKYIRTESTVFPNSVLAEELYNLRDDPGETVNLIGLETDEVRKFKLEAINALEQLKKSKIEHSTSFERLRVKNKIKKLPKL
jgi:arylsulfatase A-like enzyme